MKPLALTLLPLLATLAAAAARAQAPGYPPLRDYLMPRDSEIALAKTAAPANIASRASIKVLTSVGISTRTHGRQRLRLRSHARLGGSDVHARPIPQLRV